MTNASSTARPASAAGDVGADLSTMDLAARGPLLLLLGSGLGWLVISGLLALITSIQLHSPHFLAQYSFLTYGRAEAMRQTAFVYGWAANAGLATALWVLGRLGGQPLRGLNWTFAGAAFWNLGLTAGVIGMAVGDLTSFSLFQLPRYVQPLMVVAYGALALAGVLAWSGRRTATTFAAQWYAVAALFLFPWLSSLAQLVLLWSPLRGVAQAVGAGWYGQGVFALWLAPLALAGAYYVVPKVSGRALRNYDSAPLGFWTLIFIGAWAGGRRLIGGPVPAWVATLAIVAVVVVLVHYIIVGMNLRGILGVRGTAAGFIRFGLLAYLLTGVLEAVTAFRSVAVHTQFTLVDVALEQLALYGGLSMLFFGTIYFMVPRLTGRPWLSAGLTAGHRIVVMLGVVLLVVTLGVGGAMQGADLLHAKVPFAAIAEHLRLPLLVLSGVHLLLLGGNVLLLVNFLLSIRASVVADVTALSPIRSSTEAPAS